MSRDQIVRAPYRLHYRVEVTQELTYEISCYGDDARCLVRKSAGFIRVRQGLCPGKTRSQMAP